MLSISGDIMGDIIGDIIGDINDIGKKKKLGFSVTLKSV